MKIPVVSTPIPAAAVVPGSARSAATAVSPALTTRGPEPLSLSPTAHAARDMAALPPIDAGKVAALKSQIAAGSYTIDPGRIADAMIALDLP